MRTISFRASSTAASNLCYMPENQSITVRSKPNEMKKLTDETIPAEFENKRSADDYSQLKGWGIDADPNNDPTYPIKKRTDEEQKGYTWQRPPLQEDEVEILKSVERPNLTAVFGTSVPPRGLSGAIRRLAFKYSESSLGRWIPLVLADRINVVEGIIDDIAHGHLPNFWKERGGNAAWKYNRTQTILKISVTTLVIAGTVAWMLAGKRKRA